MYDFVAIDFETANNNLNSACSIGVVAVKDLKIVEREYYLIKPPTNTFSSDNTAIHGITYNDVRNSDQFPVIFKKLERYFENVMVAHNAQFDFSVLKNLIDTYKMDPIELLYLDSRTIACRSCDCGQSLDDVLNYLSIPIGNHHNALDDAEACANILINLTKRLALPSFTHFALLQNSDIAKFFSRINANKTFRRPNTSFQRVKISDVTAASIEFNENHLFYQKSIVLTGELENLERAEAMQKIVDVGGIVKSSVSRKTDYLVVGIQDKKLVGDDGMSTKEERAHSLIQEGCDIKILNEGEFIRLLS